jgi:hypothetical protein
MAKNDDLNKQPPPTGTVSGQGHSPYNARDGQDQPSKVGNPPAKS